MKKIDKFYKLITDGLVKLGAVKNPNDFYKWSINTKYGKLKINIHNNDTTMNVFTKFCDPSKPIGLTHFNDYSGKWNFHYGDIRGKNVAVYAEIILNEIKKILP